MIQTWQGCFGCSHCPQMFGGMSPKTTAGLWCPSRMSRSQLPRAGAAATSLCQARGPDAEAQDGLKGPDGGMFTAFHGGVSKPGGLVALRKPDYSYDLIRCFCIQLKISASWGPETCERSDRFGDSDISMASCQKGNPYHLSFHCISVH